MFRTVPLSIIGSFFTVHTAEVYVIQVLLTAVSKTCMTYTSAVYTVKKTPGDGQRNCPKHVEFYSKNKFEKLLHLVGFTIRIIKICKFI